MKLTVWVVCLALCLAARALAETITVATYNVEHFHENFLGHRMATSKPALPDNLQVKQVLEKLKNENDEDNWEVAQVILDPRFSPDVLVIQEGCRQEDLEFFNKRWLNGAYETLVTFPSNTTRDQHLNLLLKPGFKVLERRDKYHLEPDTVANARGERLFARGPAFALIQSPSGYKFWVGTTHQKSKGGNSKEMTEWRNREAKRTHEIMKELERTGGTDDVILLGDMNDDLGVGEFELDGGGDVIANLVGPPASGFVLATRPLVDQGRISFGGYWNTRFRGFIDHVVVSKGVKDQIEQVQVVDWALAPAASDHYPVMIKIRADGRN
jgi:endonuclease/exonuclease/phosphatase family metal-dependent hydrolase